MKSDRSSSSTTFPESPWDFRVWAWTSGTLALLIGVCFLLGLSLGRGPWIWAEVLVLLPFLSAFLFMPRELIVGGGLLKVEMVARSAQYKLTELERAELASRDDVFGGWTWRTFGSGGLFGYYGRFRNSKLGAFTAYVTNAQKLVLLKFRDKTVIVSPADPNAFLERLRPPQA